MNKRNIIYILLLLLIIIGFYINCYYEIENYEKETVSTKELSNKINTHEKILDKHTILLKIQDLRSELNLLKNEFQTKIENHKNSINNLNKNIESNNDTLRSFQNNFQDIQDEFNKYKMN